MWGLRYIFIGCANLKCEDIQFTLNRPQAKRYIPTKIKVPLVVNKTLRDPALQGIVTLAG